ncbi:hypothetical protein [Comamonas sp. NoAH]|uniref:hypothetical protein n=1 Tax=Comamonas halotolerans TaxID=3041496 RepID=UPI0024E0648C|nr:hypothetical protein [Comamonas sp. NoAH]
MRSAYISSLPLRLIAAGTFSCLLLTGCITYTVVGAAASVAGLAVDAAVGTVKIVGKGVGAAVDAMSDDDEDEEGKDKDMDAAEQTSYPQLDSAADTSHRSSE